MRRTPYTKAGIRRVRCARCGQGATEQWQICADDNQWRGICTGCDVALNDLVLRFVRDPDRAAKIARYRKRLEAARV